MAETNESHIDRVWEVIAKAGICMMVTRFAEGLRARPRDGACNAVRASVDDGTPRRRTAARTPKAKGARRDASVRRAARA